MTKAPTIAKKLNFWESVEQYCKITMFTIFSPVKLQTKNFI